MQDIAARRIKTGEFSTYFLESGDARFETVIFLHGGGPGATAQSNWWDIIPEFAVQYHVLAPDIYGFGKTDHPDVVPKSLLEWFRHRIRQVISLMDVLEVKKAHLVGNSMGGALALHLVMAAPERFERVVLMGSAGGPISANPTPELKRMMNFYKDDPTLDAYEQIIKWFAYDESVLGNKIKEIAQERYKEIMRPEIRRSYESMYPIESIEVPPSALRRMNNPFLIIHGREDRFVPMESSMYMFKHIPNAQLHIFERCGHWVQLERKESFKNLIISFFKNQI